uniref:Uncharacterized protein n=1 Tax=Anguilla anguilla TaxID=7936 RepID=A0A0E9WQQ2_ANGAN
MRSADFSDCSTGLFIKLDSLNKSNTTFPQDIDLAGLYALLRQSKRDLCQYMIVS